MSVLIFDTLFLTLPFLWLQCVNSHLKFFSKDTVCFCCPSLGVAHFMCYKCQIGLGLTWYKPRLREGHSRKNLHLLLPGIPTARIWLVVFWTTEVVCLWGKTCEASRAQGRAEADQAHAVSWGRRLLVGWVLFSPSLCFHCRELWQLTHVQTPSAITPEKCSKSSGNSTCN